MIKRFDVSLSGALLAMLVMLGCSDNASTAVNAAPDGEPEATQSVLDVYKSPSCGCCGGWIDHLEGEGFAVRAHHPDDLDAVKADKGITGALQSCHTAVSAEGYVFEGHIPARYVRQFLNEKPEDAIGLAVPAMPVGSPGMEHGERFTPYEVLLLQRDGSTRVYASVGSPADQ